MADFTHLDDLPLEIHDLVIKHVVDDNEYTLQLFSGSGMFRFPDYSMYDFKTMARIRRDTIRPKVIKHQWWEMDDVEVTFQRARDTIAWLNSGTDPWNSIIPLAHTDSKRRAAIGRYLRKMDMPVQISTPGIPDVQFLTDLQRSIVESTSTLIFRHSPLPFLDAETSSLLEKFESLKYVMFPYISVSADLPLHLWHGKLLATGVFLGDAYAHEVLLHAVRNLIPDWYRRREDANVSLSKISIIMDIEILLRPGASGQDVNQHRGSLLVVAAREISGKEEEPYIISVRWADNWKRNQFTSQYSGDDGLWTRAKREKKRYERECTMARPEATRAEIAARMGPMFLPSLFMVKPRFRETMVEEWEHWKEQNIEAQQQIQTIDFRMQDPRWSAVATTDEI